MTDTVVLQADGRIDLSPRLRSALPWPSGTQLVASSEGDSLVLKPVSSGAEARMSPDEEALGFAHAFVKEHIGAFRELAK